jgi:hypothetical protein
MSRRTYDISIKGAIDDSLCAEFEDIEVLVGHSTTRLLVDAADTAVLHGILGRIASLGLELLDVRRLEEPAVVRSPPRR